MDVQVERNKKVNLYLKKSQLGLQDDYLQLGQSENIDFIEIENAHFYDDQVNENDRYIATVYIR